MELQYRSLKNYSRYKIRNDGSVFDLKLQKLIKQQTNKDGYKVITLRLDSGKRKTERVHRLVALAFIDNPYNKETVNHIDGIKSNNQVSNLEWATRSEQVQHAWNNNLIKDHKSRKQGIRENQGKKVICITTGEIFNSIGEAAEVKDLKKSNISAVCRNKKNCKSAGVSESGEKLIWRFYEELSNDG